MNCSIACIGTGDLYNKSKKIGIPTVSFSLKEMLMGNLKDYIEKNNVDIINFHGPKANFIYMLIKGSIDRPVTTTIHSDYRYDFLNNKIKKYFYTPLNVIALKRFYNYICASNYLKNLLEEKNFKGNKYIVSNGFHFKEHIVNISRDKIRKEYGLSDNDYVYIMVGRMHPIKNHLGLINCFYKLQKEFSNIKLMLLGDGELENSLKDKVCDLKIKDKVIFTGFKNNPIDYINACDISILTSFNEGGAPPLVVLESALVKKAIICSNVGDMPFIINSNNGFLINPNSQEDIYDKMKKAYLNKDKLKDIGENLYKDVLDRFSIEKFWQNYYIAYSNILSGVK